MIHYDLRCAGDHGFDGWFKDSASFEAQSKAGLLECPECGSAEVRRALMSPALPRKGNARAEPVPATPAVQPVAARTPGQMAPGQVAPGQVAPGQVAPGNMMPGQIAVDPARIPAQVRAMLQKLRAEVEKNCDYVGEGFADEARRIQRGESDRRGIYGEASPEQAESLREDGIEIAHIPWVPRSDG
jgi:hypothetical protein